MTAVDWRAYFAEREAQDLAEFDEFLRIPSISTMPEYAAEVRKAAEWVAARMKKAASAE